MRNASLFERHVSARLLDFFSFQHGWQRRLWTVGLVLGLKKALEAARAVQEGALSAGAFQWLRSSLEVLAGRDRALTREDHSVVQQCLRSGLTHNGVNFRRLGQITAKLEGSYLERWARVLSSEQSHEEPERTARSLASHLLDADFSPEYLHRWWKGRILGEKHSFPEIVDEAHSLYGGSATEFEVLIPFSTAPFSKTQMPPEWRQSTEVADWLKKRVRKLSGLRQSGGLVIPVSARDSWAAAGEVADIVHRLAARVALGTRSQLLPLDRVWVAEIARPAKQAKAHSIRQRRNVEVGALQREGKLYWLGRNDVVDSALELLAPLEEGPLAPAVAGGWAAIEALLVGPGDGERTQAGDRLAALVACSFPRAELTQIAYTHLSNLENTEKGGMPLDAETNLQRARFAHDAILAGKQLALTDPSDHAAVFRMRKLLDEPRKTLRDVHNYVAAAFRRLYRQRNMVLHWGKTDTVALRASVRIVAPLVGAGIDRIAHAWFTGQVVPLDLAAQAMNQLELVGTPSGRGPLELLE